MSDLSRRDFLVKGAVSAAVAAAATAHVMAAKQAMAARLRGAGAANSAPAVTSITIVRTGAKYALLREAISAAIAMDEILIPAGTYAPDYPQYPYAYWDHYATPGADPGTGFKYMYIYIPLTFTGVGTANNGRVKWEMPYMTLTADVPASTPAPWTAQVDSTALINGFDPGIAPRAIICYSLLNPGAAALLDPVNFDAQVVSEHMNFDPTSITPTTVSVLNESPGVDMPAGTILRVGVFSSQGFIVPISANPGVVLNNIEILDTVSYGTNNSPIFQIADGTPGITGSITANNCFFHNCMTGPRGSGCAPGAGTFMHFFNTECYENGLTNLGIAQTHNFYIPPVDEAIFDNCYTHMTNGAHLLKSRARVTYVTYSRNTGERTDFSDPVESCNFDISDGGLTYLVGNQVAQSVYPASFVIKYAGEGNQNPLQEIYVVNNTIRGSPLGYGWDPGLSSPLPGYSNQSLALNNTGVGQPFMSSPSQVSGGSLPQRSYVVQATSIDATGAESQAFSPYYGGIADPYIVSANSLLYVPSIEDRTGAVAWNFYQSYADPRIYPGNNPGGGTGPGGYFWDVAETQPILTETASGSLPSLFVGVLVTYQFGAFESVNSGLMGSGYGSNDGYTFSMGFYTTANTVFSVASPPMVTGATGYNVYSCSDFGARDGFLTGSPMVKQNATPIAIGTPWTEPAAGINNVGMTYNQNWYKQNASPIATGTAWTEATGGIVNHNPFKLIWKRRTAVQPYGTYQEWYAIVPSTLTSYVIGVQNLYGIYDVAAIVVSGATGFDPDPTLPHWGNSGDTINTTDANTLVIGYVPGGGPQAGWTAVPSGGVFAQYKTFSSPQTGLPVTASGGGQIIVDALAGSSSSPTVSYATSAVTSVSNVPQNTNLSQLTIPSANPGDIIVLLCAGYFGLATVDPTYPWSSLSFSGSPIGYYDNNLVEYFCTTGTGGYIAPTGFVTQGTHNVQSNYSTNNNTVPVTFNTPLPGFVNESNYDYNLVSGSVARGAGTNPGSSPYGYSLVPAYQISYVGLPTPGAPIPPLIARPNTGGVFDAGAFEYGV